MIEIPQNIETSHFRVIATRSTFSGCRFVALVALFYSIQAELKTPTCSLWLLGKFYLHIKMARKSKRAIIKAANLRRHAQKMSVPQASSLTDVLRSVGER